MVERSVELMMFPSPVVLQAIQLYLTVILSQQGAPFNSHMMQFAIPLLLTPPFKMLFAESSSICLFSDLYLLPTQHASIIGYTPLKSIPHIPPRKQSIPCPCLGLLSRKKTLVHLRFIIFHHWSIWIQPPFYNRHRRIVIFIEILRRDPRRRMTINNLSIDEIFK